MACTSSEQWIEMTRYNKLKIAILTIMTSQSISAITINPIQIQSGSGDLLYAEMKFSNANPNEKIEVGLAEAEDMMSVGFANQPPGHLNFYTRRSNDGTGVIVITSSRPMVDPELNILLKVKEGSATHLQQIKTALTRGRPNPATAKITATNNEKLLKPQVIVSEKDIALNLPSSTSYQANTPISTSSTVKSVASINSQRPLVISVTAPPILQSTQKTAPQVIVSNNIPAITQQAIVAPVQTIQQIQNVQKITTPTEVATVKAKPEATKTETTQPKPETAKAETAKIEAAKPKAETAKAEGAKLKPEATKTETAKSKPEATKTDTTKSKPETAKTETAKAAAKTAPPAKPHTKKANNGNDPEHVVQANESLWTIASRIAAETHQSIPEVMKQIKENNANAFIQGDINRIRRGAALNLAASYKQSPQVKYKTPTAPITTRKQSGSAKYRLDQAEMSLIADNEQNSPQGSAKKNTQVNQTNTELSTKVMTSREKTVKLQRNVTQLASALQEKNRRIQLLNARLAQLQQQLQQQNVKQPKS